MKVLMRIISTVCVAFLLLSGCESTPTPDDQTAQQSTSTEGAVENQTDTDFNSWTPAPEPVVFDSLPGWQDASIAPGLNAFRRSCESIQSQNETNAPLSLRARWAGSFADWKPICAALDVIEDESSARAVLQALLTPVEILAEDGASKFTGYFEPTYSASYTQTGPFTEPVPLYPTDLIQVAGKPVQTLSNGKTRPYPTRAEITAAGVTPLAFARPGDVFFMQIQGSGRLIFENGSTIRAVYAAHNGHPFVSTANWLMDRGWITRGQASMEGIKSWMASAPEKQLREAVNANPRFVFFKSQPEGYSKMGPNGSAQIPLTPLGSLAVDLSFHAQHVPLFVSTTAPGLGGDWSGLVIAQDTGGAIKGAVRGDIYFGTGTEAGQAADTMNAPGKMWVLLPRSVLKTLEEKKILANGSQAGQFAIAP